MNMSEFVVQPGDLVLFGISHDFSPTFVPRYQKLGDRDFNRTTRPDMFGIVTASVDSYSSHARIVYVLFPDHLGWTWFEHKRDIRFFTGWATDDIA
jgi:hypothetical protein